MPHCTNHPDRETSMQCMKHGTYLCDDCLQCIDPQIHCKFRPSCPIWFLDKRGGKNIDNQASPQGEHPSHQVQA